MRARAIVVIGACGIVIGCGAAGAHAPSVAHKSVSAQGVTASTAPSGPPNCNALPSPPTYHSCVVKGRTYPVADIGQAATLPTLRIKVDRVTTVRSFPPPLFDKPPVIAHGRFVVVKVTVANRVRGDDTCCQFADTPYGQTELVGRGGTTYMASSRGELGDAASFARLSNNNIYAGETATGDLVYDIPTAAVSALVQHGVLVVSDFNWNPQNTGNVVLLKLA
jgi:hypothetical protein